MMDAKFEHIKAMLTELHDLQKGHIQAFREEKEPDIALQTLERERAFAEFKKEADNFIKACNAMPEQEKAQSMLHAIQEKIDTLVEQNRELEAIVKQRKNQIQISLNKISKGRRAINLYGSSASFKNTPKVISLTN